MVEKAHPFRCYLGGDLHIALKIIVGLIHVHLAVRVHVNGEAPGELGPILRKDLTTKFATATQRIFNEGQHAGF
jgi:hypothetical protein